MEAAQLVRAGGVQTAQQLPRRLGSEQNTQHVTENYAFTAFQLLLVLDPDFNPIINQSAKLTKHQEKTKHLVQICMCLMSRLGTPGKFRPLTLQL